MYSKILLKFNILYIKFVKFRLGIEYGIKLNNLIDRTKMYIPSFLNKQK